MKSWNLSEWKRLSDDLHADCRIFDIRKRKFHRASDQKEGDFFVLDTNDWAIVLAVTKNEEIVLVRQFRFGTEEFSLEPPGGVIDKGESPVLAGERELQEETGYTGKTSLLIGSVFPNSAIMSNRCHFLLVNDVEKTSATSFDPHEELETVLVPLSEIKDLVKKGDITHSIALNGIFHLLLHLGL
jgi:ADP-ribose pyrophosphatase